MRGRAEAQREGKGAGREKIGTLHVGKTPPNAPNAVAMMPPYRTRCLALQSGLCFASIVRLA
jgi:hypothetical protein